MKLTFRPIVVWPGPMTKDRKTHAFKATWTETLKLLDQELQAIDVVESTLVLQAAASERDIRLDGQLRADARLAHPGVILNFEARGKGALSFPCDTFDRRYGWQKLDGWQANVRAIALGLEALRKIDRYGIANIGQQYTGWKQLGEGSPMPAAAMTVDEAARFIAAHTDLPDLRPDDVPWPQRLIDEPRVVESGYRRAAKRLHPDAGGDPALFRRLNEARDLIETNQKGNK